MRLIARAAAAVLAGVLLAALVAGAVLTNQPADASAAATASAVNLRTAASFSVLGGSTVTSIPPTSMNAELGLSPGSSVTGAPSASATHIDDAIAVKAKSDLTSAYGQASAAPTNTVIPDAGDIGGKQLTPGVYASASSMFLTGTVTLNGGGNPNAVFIFKAGSTVITASSSVVKLTGGAQACNVYWQVGSSATVGSGSSFVGTVLALTSITSNSGAKINGRLLARNGAVTLDHTTINTHPCSGTGSTTSTTSTPTATGPTTTTSQSTTTITQTSTSPCSCVTPAPKPKPLPAKTLKPVKVAPGHTVTVKLPPPGCGCVVTPGAPRPPVVKYVVVWVPAHCHVTVNQRKGKLTFRAAKGHHGKFTVRVKRGRQEITCHFVVRRLGHS